MTTIDFRTDPVRARRHRVVSLVTHADIPDIIWADDETGQRCEGQTDRRGAVWADQDRQREEVTMPDRNNAELWEDDDRWPPAHLHRYGRGGHNPLSLLRDALPLRSSIETARCRPAGQFLC